FDSQIAGGKNYSDAVIGRRHANASFYKSHSVDSVDQIWYAMDLTEPCHDDSIDLKDFVLRKVRVLQDSIAASLD
ncbi:MAG: PIG-L family deacetylase, partial [Verrucomicrobiota bacterium]|nr:PIG-L family deacetylase [Verrucomicrobiota bacterium]